MTLYFDAFGSYWVRVGDRFVALAKEDVKLHALRATIKDKPEPNLSALESLFWRAQTFRHVNYAGPLAGHRVGPLELSSGERVLVTTEAAIFKRKVAKGKRFPFIEAFIETLLVGGHDHFIGWLSVAVKSLIRGDFVPGQMVVFAGPGQCGKSLMHVLITQLLGGRMAKPYGYLVGKTAFNGHIARAEHLVIEDEAASTDVRARNRFGSGVKQLTVAAEMSVNDKFKIEGTFPTFKRLSLSVNDEPENLMILPPLDNSIVDKVCLFRCKDATGKLSEDRPENMRRLMAELPAFDAYLRGYRIPKSLQDHRFGVRAYHDGELLDTLAENQPEARLCNLIDEVLFRQGAEHWRGSATELEQQLRNSAFSGVASQLFYYSTACGVFLSRLEAKDPERFRSTKSKGRTTWEIKA